MDSDIKQKPGGSLSPSKKNPELFLHVADPVGVVGLRRGRLTVNWQGQSRGRGWGQEQKPRSLSFPWNATVSLDWTGHLACLAEVHGLFTKGRVA